jgi:hypothetical protein
MLPIFVVDFGDDAEVQVVIISDRLLSIPTAMTVPLMTV